MADYKEDTLDDALEANEPEAKTPTEPEEAPAEPEEQPEQPEQRTVPLAALHEERDKRKADSERLKVLEQELEALKTPKQERQEQESAPDMFADPEGYNAYWEKRLQAVQQSNQQQLINERLNISERHAAKEHGQETVDEMKAWFAERVQQSPGFQSEVINQPDPYDFAIREFKKDKFVSSVDASEFEQFQAWKAAQESGEPAPVAPKTTANARSVARKTPEPFDTDEALDDILTKT